MMVGYLSDVFFDSELNGRNKEDVSYNSLFIILDYLIFCVKEICFFILYYNEFLFIFKFIFLFGNLLIFDLSNNYLIDLLKELIILKNLWKFVVKSNGLICLFIFKDFGLLLFLEELNFSGNMFEVFFL